jgi:hypothetical protein
LHAYEGKYARVHRLVFRDAPASCIFEHAIDWKKASAFGRFDVPRNWQEIRIAVVPRRHRKKARK